MKSFLRSVLLAVLLVLGNAVLLQAQTEAEPKALFQKVLGSTLENNYPALMSVCDQGMKDTVTAEMLADLNRQMMLRFRTGYAPSYMGYLEKQGAKIHYWKLVMKDRGDDVLMTLVVRGGLVSAFNLK